MTTTVGLREIPDGIRSLAALADADYGDLYSATTSMARLLSPEEWARAVLEDAPLSRRSAYRLWRRLGLRLGPRGSREHIQGWAIAARGDDWIRITTGSWYMSAEAVFHRGDEEVSIAVFLRFDKPVARLVWIPVGRAHRRAVPVMLRQAVAAQREAPG